MRDTPYAKEFFAEPSESGSSAKHSLKIFSRSYAKRPGPPDRPTGERRARGMILVEWFRQTPTHEVGFPPQFPPLPRIREESMR
jgi:hypothetical protein